MKKRSTIGPTIKNQSGLFTGLIILFLHSPWLWLAATGASSDLIGFYPDDAFYYLKTA